MTIVIDGRELQPPEPMERTLEALDRLGEGDDILLLLYCQPHPLFKGEVGVHRIGKSSTRLLANSNFARPLREQVVSFGRAAFCA